MTPDEWGWCRGIDIWIMFDELLFILWSLIPHIEWLPTQNNSGILPLLPCRDPCIDRK